MNLCTALQQRLQKVRLGRPIADDNVSAQRFHPALARMSDGAETGGPPGES